MWQGEEAKFICHGWCEKDMPPFLEMPFHYKIKCKKPMIILPRQARDKHRENSKKVRFLIRGVYAMKETKHWIQNGEKTPFLRCHFVLKNDDFTKTGSGQA
eukprot:COSAG06_NODE_616_length_13755_cov_32.672452_9_plen_101_part_00